MNLRDLSYLVAVAEHQHFGKAADACFVSQPTLSTQIKKLEEELGVTLIERGSKQVLITEIGAQIITYAKQVLKLTTDIKQLADNYSDPKSGTLRLGVIPTLGPYLLPHIMPILNTHFAKLRFLLYEEKTADLMHKLDNGKLDAALLALPVDDASFTTRELFDEPFLVALPTQNRLAKRAQLSLHELKEEPILLLEDGHCMRDQTLNLCHDIGADEIEDFRATSLETLRQMVISKAGITFMPWLAVHASGTTPESLSIVALKKPAPSRKIVLAYRNSSHRKIVLDELQAIIKNHMSGLFS